MQLSAVHSVASAPVAPILLSIDPPTTPVCAPKILRLAFARPASLLIFKAEMLPASYDATFVRVPLRPPAVITVLRLPPSPEGRRQDTEDSDCQAEASHRDRPWDSLTEWSLSPTKSPAANTGVLRADVTCWFECVVDTRGATYETEVD